MHLSLTDLSPFDLVVLQRASSQLREAQVNVATAQVLFVKLVLGSVGLSFTLEEDKGVTGRSALVKVDSDVTLSHSEVLEEITDLSGLCGEGKSTHLQAGVPVLSIDEVGKTDSLTTTETAITAITSTTASIIASSTAGVVMTTVTVVSVVVIARATVITVVVASTTTSAATTSTATTAATATTIAAIVAAATTATARAIEVAAATTVFVALLVLEVVVLFVHDADQLHPT